MVGGPIQAKKPPTPITSGGERRFVCQGCGRHLFKYDGKFRVVKIRCKKCGFYNVFRAPGVPFRGEEGA